MLELALNYGGGPVQIANIAGSQKVPIRFLEQLLLVLKRNGLVTSNRGRQGGYSLAKSPGSISLLDAVESLEGPIELAGRKMKKLPVLFEAFEKIEEGLKKGLAGKTLDDLVFSKRQKDRAYTYSI